MTTNYKFVTNQGDLTAAALACGYRQVADDDLFVSKNCYILLLKKGKLYYVEGKDNENTFVIPFIQLTDARRWFHHKLGNMKTRQQELLKAI